MPSRESAARKGWFGMAAAERPVSRREIEEMLRKTQRLFERHRFEQARRLCRQILELEPENAEALNNLGAVYLAEGDFEQADRYLRQALGLDPGLESASDNLRKLDALRRQGHEALEPAGLELLLENSRTLTEEGRFQEAVALLEDLVALDPVNVRALNNLGIIYFRMGELSRAEEYFMDALKLYFTEGLLFDDVYAAIKDNLRRLRATAGFQKQEELKRNHLQELAEHLPSESIRFCISGNARFYRDEKLVEAGAVLAATTRGLILYCKNCAVFGGQAYFETIPYERVQGVQSRLGIVRATLTVDTDQGQRQLVSWARDEVRQMQAVLQEFLDKGRPQIGEDLPLALATAVLTTLLETGVLSEEEYARARKRLVRRWR
jgi:superkiller protein 3